MSNEEFMFDGESTRVAYPQGSPEFDAMVERLSQQFSVGDTGTWFSVSSAVRNDIYDDDVVSVIFRAAPPYLDFLEPMAVGRKFFLNHGWVYDKVYLYIPPGQNVLPHPEGARPLFLGKLLNVMGQPGDQDLSRYQCLFFMHQDHAAVEAWAKRSLPQGKYSTFYAATFDTLAGDKLLRMKTYCYDDQGGFSDWDVTYLQLSKARGFLDDIK